MTIEFRLAAKEEASIVATLAFALTEEICERTNARHFNIDLNSTIRRCEELFSGNHYGAILGWDGRAAVAVATFSETYALYAGGRIGVIQEFYVVPSLRSAGVGADLIESVRRYGRTRDWSCVELCTPPLPEFERTLKFYEANGLAPVGGRKMRQNFERDI